MTKNTLLNIGINICKSIGIFYIILLVVFTGLFVHFQISPSSYDHVTFKKDVGFFHIATKDIVHVDGEIPDKSDVFVVDKLTYPSLYLNFIKYFVVFLLSYFCVKEFQKVMESVKKIETFKKSNVMTFRRIGKFLMVIFVLTCYSRLTYQQGTISAFSISFAPLLLALIAFIMAEVFKEGNNLSEENKLTV